MKQVRVVLGRFQPMTLGHLKMITYNCKGPKEILGYRSIQKPDELREQPDIQTINQQKTVVLVIETPLGTEDQRHPFNTDLIKKELDIVKRQYKEIEDIFYVKSADICAWGELLKKNGYQASVWITGEDEAKSYVEMAVKVPEYEDHNRDNRDCKDAYTKSFYVEVITRSDSSEDFSETISGTKVRETLKNNDMEYFKKAMPDGTDVLFDEFKEAVMNAPEVKPKKKVMKSIKEYLNESLGLISGNYLISIDAENIRILLNSRPDMIDLLADCIYQCDSNEDEDIDKYPDFSDFPLLKSVLHLFIFNGDKIVGLSDLGEEVDELIGF